MYRTDGRHRPRRTIAPSHGRSYGSGEIRGKTKPEAPSKADAALASVLELFESGELPDLVARSWIARQDGDSPMVNWSLGNQLLALLAGTTDARGFHQWKAVGRNVEKGSKAFHILGPSTRKFRAEDPDTGEETVVSRIVGFHAIPVFRFEDTDGCALETPDYEPPAPPPLAHVAERWGIPVVYGPNVGQSWLGVYRHARRSVVSEGWAEGATVQNESITLATHHEQVFFHELAHAAHRRVLSATGGDLGLESSRRKELVAELTAAVLGRLHGLSLGDLAWSKAYLQAHAGGKSVASACLGVLNDVQACLRLLLEESPGVTCCAELEAVAA
jgi:hypothetical protein